MSIANKTHSDTLTIRWGTVTFHVKASWSWNPGHPGHAEGSYDGPSPGEAAHAEIDDDHEVVAIEVGGTKLTKESFTQSYLTPRREYSCELWEAMQTVFDNNAELMREKLLAAIVVWMGDETNWEE